MTKLVYFSGATGGFYFEGLHSNIPVDAVVVTPAAYQQLIQSQSNGARIVADANGSPVSQMPSAATTDQLLQAWRQTFEVSAFQAKAALFNRDKLAAAEAVAQAAGGLVLLAWQTAQTFQRRSPAINQMLPVIGITDPLDQDELFREAALITA